MSGAGAVGVDGRSRLAGGFSRTARPVSALVLAAEAYLFWRYAAYGTLFHYWLHLLFGGTIAFAALAIMRLARPNREPNVWGWGFAGHLWSAIPDIAFVLVGILHYYWMDVFALHVTIHFIPAPLLTTFVTFSLALLAWAIATIGWCRLALTALVLTAAVSVAALALRTPPPATLEQLRANPQLALLCPVAEPPRLLPVFVD
ncbi:MAG: hypothetical protein ACRDZO_09890 [Egibacteraceae bacterium]